MHKVRWGDLQYVMAIASEGSVSGAAKSLDVNHSTVLRRLDAFEYRHKVKLFKRSASGYTLTPKGEQLLCVSSEIEQQVFQIERSISAQELELEGWLKITTTDTLFHYMLAPHLRSFQKHFEKIQMDIELTPKSLDLNSLESDVAIRSVNEPPAGASGEKLICSQIFCYATSAYMQQVKGELAVEKLIWCLPSMVNLKNPVWYSALGSVPEHNIKVKADSFNTLLGYAENDMGVALLPDFLGDNSAVLSRVNLLPNLPITTIWIIAHVDLLKSKKVTELIKHLKASLT
ncbi:LysR family transcriptional regulator [Shewanella olleyana]|uniref:LysR family transcriptional regulator n=1 Tax=Shewanella olleyana TaxID=135626 RepID=UPI00200DEE4C|nr:LysR family transcriptional regulator [Shewanella olleyana]MCL1068851.1 LysR family transcriptional regulator [Shewanella olleyana]